MTRFQGSVRVLGAGLLVLASACTVYVVPAEEAGSGEEAPASSEEPAATGGAVGAEVEEERDDDGPAVRGARGRDAPDTRRVSGAEATGSEPTGAEATGIAGAEDRRAFRRARAGSRRLRVPPGHHPPRGQCRIWYEDVPPGRQPPPAPCDELLDGIYPEGAFILYGGNTWDGNYDWSAAAAEFPGVVPPPVIALASRVGADPSPSARRRADRGLGAAADGSPGHGSPSDGLRDDGPRVVDVPRGQRPPDGLCRIWREGRSPARQDPAVACEELAGRELEAGVFILYGDRSFDVDHDWARTESRTPGTVPPALLEVLLGGVEEDVGDEAAAPRAETSEDGSHTEEASRTGGASAEGASAEEASPEGASADGAASGRDAEAAADSTAGTPGDRGPVVDLPDRDRRRPGAPRR